MKKLSDVLGSLMSPDIREVRIVLTEYFYPGIEHHALLISKNADMMILAAIKRFPNNTKLHILALDALFYLYQYGSKQTLERPVHEVLLIHTSHDQEVRWRMIRAYGAMIKLCPKIERDESGILTNYLSVPMKNKMYLYDCLLCLGYGRTNIEYSDKDRFVDEVLIHQLRTVGAGILHYELSDYIVAIKNEEDEEVKTMLLRAMCRDIIEFFKKPKTKSITDILITSVKDQVCAFLKEPRKMCQYDRELVNICIQNEMIN